MTEIVDLGVSRRRAAGVAFTRQGCRTSAKGVSRARDTGASNRKSLNKYNNDSPSFCNEVEVETSVLRQSRRRRSGRFLRGPISLHLIAEAARLPGRALAVLLAIHHQVTLTGKPLISLPAGLLIEFSVDRNAKARALRQLERAGLIRVERALGRAARVGLSRAAKAARGTDALRPHLSEARPRPS